MPTGLNMKDSAAEDDSIVVPRVHPNNDDGSVSGYSAAGSTNRRSNYLDASEKAPEDDAKTAGVETAEELASAADVAPTEEAKAADVETTEDAKATKVETTEDAKAAEVETTQEVEAVDVETTEGKATYAETAEEVKAAHVESAKESVTAVADQGSNTLDGQGAEESLPAIEDNEASPLNAPETAQSDHEKAGIEEESTSASPNEVAASPAQDIPSNDVEAESESPRDALLLNRPHRRPLVMRRS